MHPLTTIARPIDPSYPTNRAINILMLLISTGAAAYSSLYLGAALFAALLQGFVAGIAIFFAWAISRELDPDSEYAAFLPALICIPLLIIVPEPGLLISLFLLLLLRIVNRTTGQSAGVLDSAALLLLTGWLVIGGFWVAGLAAVAALILDGHLKGPNPRQLWFVTLLIIGMFAYLSLFGSTLTALSLPAASWLFIPMLITPLLFISVIIRKGRILSGGDQSGEPLDRGRVQAARLLVFSVVMVAIATGGEGAAALLMPVWAALVGLGMYECVIRIGKGLRVG